MGEEVRLREPDRKQLILETVDYESFGGFPMNTHNIVHQR
jgi:hypothetical protein